MQLLQELAPSARCRSIHIFIKVESVSLYLYFVIISCLAPFPLNHFYSFSFLPSFQIHHWLVIPRPY